MTDDSAGGVIGHGVQVAAHGSVATLTLSRPQQRNPLDAQTITELTAALLVARNTEDTRVIVITGQGSSFSAGADLSSLSAELPELERHRERRRFVNLFRLMRGIEKPIIARVNGHALAGGLGLVCCCDLVVAAEEATFGMPEIRVGIWPMMVQALMSRSLPPKIVMEMAMLGRRWNASEMERRGLVNVVVPASELDDATRRLADELVRRPRGALALGKASFYIQQDMTVEAALEYLHAQTALMMLSDESREGIQAFLEKREPRFSGG
jgi:enoyl-CoA hydratase